MTAWKWTQIEPGVLGLEGAPVKIRAIKSDAGLPLYRVLVWDRPLADCHVLDFAKRSGEALARDMREIGSI